VDKGVEESPRGSMRCVLDKKKDFTLDSLIAAAYDSYLPAFDVLMPRLLKAYDAAPRRIR
jgi:acyl-homoserine-lactone acylase